MLRRRAWRALLDERSRLAEGCKIPDTATDDLHREMRVRFGPVPEALAEPLVDDGALAIAREEFLFTTPAGVRYHYRRGAGVVASLPASAGKDEFEVFLWGTVFGAVAWLNGYFALHASAVIVGSRAMAFTAGSGGGKSTLAAALSARGMPHLCDDTLVLANGEAIRAIPDGKPIKLWQSALALTGAAAQRPIATIPGKFFSMPTVPAAQATNLGDLFVLATGPSVRLERLRGPSLLSVLAEAMYRPQVTVALADGAAYGRWLMRLAQGLRVWRLERPWHAGDTLRFGRTVDAIADALHGLSE